jgi:hypothetical protein
MTTTSSSTKTTIKEHQTRIDRHKQKKKKHSDVIDKVLLDKQSHNRDIPCQFL